MLNLQDRIFIHVSADQVTCGDGNSNSKELHFAQWMPLIIFTMPNPRNLKNFFFVILLFPLQSLAQPVRDFKEETYDLRDFLLTHHVEPRTVDDGLSIDIFEKLLVILDPEKVHFTKRDIEFLASERISIDDDLQGPQWRFFDKAKQQYQSALERSRANINEILSHKFSWLANDKFIPEAESWPENEDALRVRQAQWLRHQVLGKILQYMDQEKAAHQNGPEAFEARAIETVKKLQLRKIENVLSYRDGYANYFATNFFYAVTTVFDPHTVYLSSADFRHFQQQLATDGMYFGFTIDDDEQGNITITSLTPGGPAWKSGMIDVSDRLLGIRPASYMQMIDFDGMSIEEVNEVFDEVNGDEMDFYVAKANEGPRTVTLRKERLQVEENFVRSFILKGERPIGYIHLPDFYTQWNEQDQGSRCANDVAKEILKLKRAGVQGIILDVRFNGGGSLYEAVAMAGIFIDQGPIGMTKDRNGPAILKDVNRGTVYDGPLAILVNGQSASASEVLAAALQDYRRAVIIGGRTYGKATGQKILPVKNAISEQLALVTKQGFVKVTCERLFRVTGGSVQGKGVTPDILLPDFTALFTVHESEQEFVLRSDSLEKNSFYKPLPGLPMSQLQVRSRERVNANPDFKKVMELTERYRDKVSVESESLRWTDAVQKHLQLNEVLDAIRSMKNAGTCPYVVLNHQSQIDLMKGDEFATAFNKQWLEKLTTDLTLRESFYVVNDLIELQK